LDGGCSNDSCLDVTWTGVGDMSKHLGRGGASTATVAPSEAERQDPQMNKPTGTSFVTEMVEVIAVMSPPLSRQNAIEPVPDIGAQV
jgi:hypothetical protein